jgi:hypothetical protein
MADKAQSIRRAGVRLYGWLTAKTPAGPFRPYTDGQLALTPGTRLGVYDITSRLDEGGMGQQPACR